MTFGISDKDWEFLNKHLFSFIKSQNCKMYIFGSRAKGKNHKFSDVDILVEDTPNLDKSLLSRQVDFIHESQFPYKIDLVYSSSLAASYKIDVDQSKIEI
jgi:predicted nucleotidyltransferase